jgi:hypothetical protein
MNSLSPVIYWQKYLQPRRAGFHIVIERAQARQEIQTDIDSDLVFDIISGIMLYAIVFTPTSEPVSAYIRRAISLILKEK